MREIYLTYLNRADVEAAALTDAEILATIEASLAMQGRGETVIEPRTHLEPRSGVAGHFNVLRGWIGGGLDVAGVISAVHRPGPRLGLASEHDGLRGGGLGTRSRRAPCSARQ